MEYAVHTSVSPFKKSVYHQTHEILSPNKNHHPKPDIALRLIKMFYN